MHKKAYGFTIVELLIVIVVIAILAAISIVAYTGIQQRANNTAIINAASQTKRALEAYVLSENGYPLTSSTSTGTICVTVSSGCMITTSYAGNSTFNASIAGFATLPQAVPVIGDNRYGIMYDYIASRTVDGRSQPAVLRYYLQGVNQNCGISPVMSGYGEVLGVSANAYTAGNTGGKTHCVVSIAGKEHE